MQNCANPLYNKLCLTKKKGIKTLFTAYAFVKKFETSLKRVLKIRNKKSGVEEHGIVKLWEELKCGLRREF